MFETETFEPCLVWKLKWWGAMAPWPPQWIRPCHNHISNKCIRFSCFSCSSIACVCFLPWFSIAFICFSKAFPKEEA